MRAFFAVFAGALLAGTTTAGIAQQASPDPVQTPSDTIEGFEPMDQGRMFETLDENEDGRLSPEEAGASGQDDTAFNVIDSDGDGYISREEYGENRPD